MKNLKIPKLCSNNIFNNFNHSNNNRNNKISFIFFINKKKMLHYKFSNFKKNKNINKALNSRLKLNKKK